MPEVNDDNRCFVCGEHNPQGLHLKFQYDPGRDEMRAEANFPDHLQGWHDILHGGIVSTVLDEIMVKSAAQKQYRCVTVELTVRFIQPVRLNHPYTITGKTLEIRKRILTAEARIVDGASQVVASARGKFFIVD